MLVKCKICGERHPMRDVCNFLVEQARDARMTGLGVVVMKPGEPPQRVVPEDFYIEPPAVDKFDRNAYQREYMRKWRAEAKARKLAEEGLK